MPDEIRVLLVEDVATDAELLLRELRRAGLAVKATRVETQPELRIQLEQFAPDIVLSDFTMPRFDGLSALAVSRETNPDVPFIFVSGTMGEENAVRALKSGATDYVLKSNLLRLPSAVERAVRDARDRVAARRRDFEDRRLKTLIATAFDLISTPLIVTNAKSLIQIINPAFTKAYGWSFTELAGEHFRVLLPEESGSNYQASLQLSASLDPNTRYEFYIRKKDGELVSALLSARVIRIDGEPSGRIAFIERSDGVAEPCEIRAPVAKSTFERQAADLVSRASTLTNVVAGRITLTGMRKAEAQFKENWPAKRRRIMTTAATIIGRSLGSRDLITEEEDGFVMAFYDMTEEEAQLTCRVMERRINDFLFGELGVPPSASDAGAAGNRVEEKTESATSIRLTTISAQDLERSGSFGRALEERIGPPAGLGIPSMLPSLEAGVQRRRERLLAEYRDVLAKAKINVFEIHGPRGPAGDVDCVDFDFETIRFLAGNAAFVDSEEGLKVESHLARMEMAIGAVVSNVGAMAKKVHLAYLSIEVLRDQSARRRFVSLWKLLPTDLQKRIILCFEDIDAGLAPVAVESAILQIAGLVFATGIVLRGPAVPNLNFQLVKSRIAILDHLSCTALEQSVSDKQWAGAVQALRQKGCKVFVRPASPEAVLTLASRIGADGVIRQPIGAMTLR